MSAAKFPTTIWDQVYDGLAFVRSPTYIDIKEYWDKNIFAEPRNYLEEADCLPNKHYIAVDNL